VGIDHLRQYLGASYSVIPTIGTLFVLNFASAVLLAAGLVAPLERVHERPIVGAMNRVLRAVGRLHGHGLAR
jgi:hypothetical protein